MEFIPLRKDGNPRAKLEGYMLRVTKREALSMIISLAHQIEDDDPNQNRREYGAVGSNYFSISVQPD